MDNKIPPVIALPKPLSQVRKYWATPLRPAKTTAASLNQDINLDDHQWYLNRELTWLEFNERVLNEARDARNPLLERLKFIAIVSANLDEFFMKRMGGLKEQVGAGVQTLTPDGRTPLQQINECAVKVRQIEQQRDELLPEILMSLGQQGIGIVPYRDLEKGQKKALRDYFLQDVYPLITPQMIDPAHPFPFISNLSLNLLVTLQQTQLRKLSYARIKLPVGNGIERFIAIDNTHFYVTLEDLIINNLDLLFPEVNIVNYELFHLTRNANTERDETKADDLLEMIETELRDRRFARIVRIVVESDIPDNNLQRLTTELNLDYDLDVFRTTTIMAASQLWQLVNIDVPALHNPPFQPVNHPLLDDNDIFKDIRDHGSLLLHHPYTSFSLTVERFLRRASLDPNVRAIKMTIYRTSSDTKIIGYLIDAALNGKQVAVVLELKARFDEAANIRWATRLEEAGVHVTYGVIGLKTHCKAILVIRHSNSGIEYFTHIGTGNYHAGTARLYTDLGLLSCDADLGRDLVELFNYLTTGCTPRRDYQHILPAPVLLKKTLIKKIRREAEFAAAGEKSAIEFKMNGLEDIDICRELYKASQAGVKIRLIIRDICRIRPGIKGLSDNISVISIVGRFLEHARLFYFSNLGKPDYLIGSADAMQRNLESRVEVVVPILSPDLQRELRDMLDTQWNDQRNAWVMGSQGRYQQRQPDTDANVLSCQQQFMLAAERQHKLMSSKGKKVKKNRNVR